MDLDKTPEFLHVKYITSLLKEVWSYYCYTILQKTFKEITQEIGPEQFSTNSLIQCLSYSSITLSLTLSFTNRVFHFH